MPTTMAEAYYTAFKATADAEVVKSSEELEETEHRLEVELFHMKEGRLPHQRVLDVIRMHTIVKMLLDPSWIIGALEETCEKDNAVHNWRNLWCVHRYLGNTEKAEAIRAKVGD